MRTISKRPSTRWRPTAPTRERTAAGAASLLLAGMSLDEWRSYRGAGISQYDAGEFFRGGIRPMEAARWAKSGANGFRGAALTQLGKTPNDVEAYRQAGVQGPLDWVASGIPPHEAPEWEAASDSSRPRMTSLALGRLYAAGLRPRLVKRLWREGHRTCESILLAASVPMRPPSTAHGDALAGGQESSGLPEA